MLWIAIFRYSMTNTSRIFKAENTTMSYIVGELALDLNPI